MRGGARKRSRNGQNDTYEARLKTVSRCLGDNNIQQNLLYIMKGERNLVALNHYIINEVLYIAMRIALGVSDINRIIRILDDHIVTTIYMLLCS